MILEAQLLQLCVCHQHTERIYWFDDLFPSAYLFNHIVVVDNMGAEGQLLTESNFYFSLLHHLQITTCGMKVLIIEIMSKD